jgi:hypothetical protein
LHSEPVPTSLETLWPAIPPPSKVARCLISGRRNLRRSGSALQIYTSKADLILDKVGESV